MTGKSVGSLMSILLFMLVVVSIYASCKKRKEQCVQQQCMNWSFCDNDTCYCVGAYTGKYCDSAIITGTWRNGNIMCSPNSHSNNLSFIIQKVVDDTSAATLIGLYGPGDTIKAKLKNIGGLISFTDHIVPGIYDTNTGTIQLVGKNNLRFDYMIKRGADYPCTGTYSR